MTFQGAWAPLMTWYRDLATGGGSEPVAAVIAGTAANVTKLNPGSDYSIKTMFTRTMGPRYADNIYRCVTTFPTPPSVMVMTSADPHTAANDLGYQHTFTTERLVMHCKC